MSFSYSSKFKKISDKQLKDIRFEKLSSWLKKNKKYLSLQDLQSLVTQTIDNEIKETFHCDSLGSLSRSQRDELHKRLFDSSQKQEILFSAFLQFVTQMRIPLSMLKKQTYLFDKLKTTLENYNIFLSERRIRSHLEEYERTRESLSFYQRLQMQFMIRDDYHKKILTKLKEQKLEEKEALFLLLKNEESIEKLGVQAFANESSRIEALGSQNNLSSHQEAFSLEKIQNQGIIEWTHKQKQVIELLQDSSKKVVVLVGGGRSGKTTVAMGFIFERAYTLNNHKILIVRENFNALKRSIVEQTINSFYKRHCELSFRQNLSSPAQITLENGSTINLAGIQGSNKISGLDAHLGNEYGTIYLNEASQISYESFKLLLTRLNDIQNPPKVLIDLNPTTKNHWVYKFFVEHIDPDNDEDIPEEVIASQAIFQMNPIDNQKNISQEYLKTIRSLGSAYQRRFEHGEWANFNENSIFPTDWMQWIDLKDENEKFDYVAIGVDPAVSAKETSDETGIIVCAMRREEGFSKYYVLEDLSGRYTPEQWANIVVETYRRYKNIKASKNTVVVLEKNQGGDTLNALLRVANGGLNFPAKDEFTSKDKITRAMYISSIYEKRQVFHTQKFKKLEAQMSAMGVDEYLDHDDRADALIHSLTYLFKLNNKALGTLHLV